MVEARRQLANAEVDDDWHHSTLLLLPPLGRLLEEIKAWELCSQGCCLALPLIDFLLHILLYLCLMLKVNLSEFGFDIPKKLKVVTVDSDSSLHLASPPL